MLKICVTTIPNVPEAHSRYLCSGTILQKIKIYASISSTSDCCPKKEVSMAQTQFPIPISFTHNSVDLVFSLYNYTINYLREA